MSKRAIACLVFCGFAVAARAQPIEIKMATLAPKIRPGVTS